MKRLPISLCYIVRNEEEFLKASLESAISWISEVIFLDSGSTDQTEKIAKSFEKQISSFVWKVVPWADDFSKARNLAASFATQPWILFIDGDEVLEKDAYSKIAMAISPGIQISCFSFIQRNYTYEAALEEGKRADQQILEVISSQRPVFYLDNWMERLYQRDSGIQYEGRIHESLLPSCERLGLKHSRLPVVLHHYGRLKAKSTDKLAYYLKLSEQKWVEEKESPVAWIELATVLLELGLFERAFLLCSDAVQKFYDQPEVIRIAFQSALRFEQYEAAEKWIQLFLKINPRDLYAKSQLTTALLYQKKFEAVISTANEVFKMDAENFVAHLNCSVIDFENQNWTNAARHLEIAHRQKPEDTFVCAALEKVRASLQKH